VVRFGAVRISADEKLLNADTALTRRPGSDRPQVASLRVVIDDVVQAFPLPATGEVSIGRSDDAHVVVLHASVSRRHAILRLGHEISVCDTGSANGTRLHDRKLEPHRWVELHRGDVFSVGDVSVLIHDGTTKEQARRGVGHTRFAAHLEQNLARHADVGTPFAVCVINCIASSKWVDVAHGMLLAADYMSVLSDASVALLLSGRSADVAQEWVRAVKEQILRTGARPELDLKVCPRDGSTVEALFRAPPGATQTATTHRPPPVTASPAMKKIDALVNEVASSPTSILILGETGVGKEVLARALHDRSSRRTSPFLALNCAALHETLLESELFGYEKGAFTGAVAPKAGLLELAETGTLFLDELGEMPLSTQAKLLRVLEERTVWRLGAVKPRPIHVRLLTATNRNLPAEIAAGRFRADLYYRINGLAIAIPPLRERVEEILPLAEYFAEKAGAALRKPVPVLTSAARNALLVYAWPGNIRELRNTVERGVLLSRDGVLDVDNLPDEMRVQAIPSAPRLPRDTIDLDIPSLAHEEDDAEPAASLSPPTVRGAVGAASKAPTSSREGDAEAAASSPSLRDEMERLERQRIADALEQCRGNQTQAAKLLGISRRVLMIRMHRYGLRVERSVR
jgi:two-component system, NtrC family, response regulator AtoC